MKKFMNSEQSGRSMVEMLGVLAIIGVLSVGGISGYSKAMAKFKMSKAMDQMSMLVANIRTTYASMATYTGLSTQTARSYGLASRDMFGVKSTDLVNAFGGKVFIGAVNNNQITDTGFAITYNGLDKEACMGLATADWGSAGLICLFRWLRLLPTVMYLRPKLLSLGIITKIQWHINYKRLEFFQGVFLFLSSRVFFSFRHLQARFFLSVIPGLTRGSIS